MAHYGAERCEVCQFDGRDECPEGCRFRDYFAPNAGRFAKVVDVSGESAREVLADQLEQLPGIDPAQESITYFDSVMADVEARLENRVAGTYGKFMALEKERWFLENEAAVLRHENDWFRSQYPDLQPPHLPGHGPPPFQ